LAPNIEANSKNERNIQAFFVRFHQPR
jgi:hypothetical protein